MRGAAAGFVILALGAAVYWTVRLAYADRLYHHGTPAAVAQARRLSPGNAYYFQNDPRDRPALEHAVAQNPRYSKGWIELGLLAEAGGDLQRAEQCFLAAAAADRTYEPRWTLANFYFRSRNWKEFWTWARKAAEMTSYDQTPLFRLCWRVTQDPALILARAIPDRRESLAQYLSFLLRYEKIGEAEPVAERLLPESAAESVPLLLVYCDQLIRAGRTEAALRCWNTLCRRGLLPYRVLEPPKGSVLTNGDFAAPPRAAGFDWRMTLAEGIRFTRADSPPELRISFTGKQPERGDLVAQVLPVEASRTYRLDYSWRTSGITPPSGLRWYVTELPAGRELASAPVEVSEGAWSRGSLGFPVPAGNTAVRLALEYRRAEGATRTDGTLRLRQMSAGFR